MERKNLDERSLLRTESYGSASVTWLDRPAALEAARAAGRVLGHAHPEVTGVLLFGSIARGDAIPGSDVDFLVVLRESDCSFLDRIPRYTPAVSGLGVDVLPYTEDEIVEMLGSGRQIVRTALAEGEWVFGPPEALRG